MNYCPSCERNVVGRKDVSDVNMRFLVAVILGIFTCGLAWLAMPVLVLQKATIKRTCPICNTPVR